MITQTPERSRAAKLASWIPAFGLFVEIANEDHYLSDRTKPCRYICGLLYHVACGLPIGARRLRAFMPEMNGGCAVAKLV